MDNLDKSAETIDVETNQYIAQNNYRLHPFGNYALFGTQSLGIDSTITFRCDKDEVSDFSHNIWQFNYYPNENDYVMTFVNEKGCMQVFDFNNPDIYNNAIRIEKL